jgi:hypothetical protein
LHAGVTGKNDDVDDGVVVVVVVVVVIQGTAHNPQHHYPVS